MNTEDTDVTNLHEFPRRDGACSVSTPKTRPIIPIVKFKKDWSIFKLQLVIYSTTDIKNRGGLKSPPLVLFNIAQWFIA